MITHNIKIAWRNLMKYKLQNAISIVSIAVGIVVISAVYSVLSLMHEPRICAEPYFDRTFKVTIFGEGNSTLINPTYLSGMDCMEGNVHYEYRYVQGEEWTTIKWNGKQYKTKQYYAPIDPELLNFFAIRSAITGQRIAPIKEGEAVITYQFAKKFFGDENPIGATIENSGQEFRITDVCENDIINSNEPITYNIMVPQNMHVQEEFLLRHTAYVVMKDGTDYEYFAREIASRLNKKRADVWVDQICNNGQDQYLGINVGLQTIGIMILLASIIGFLRMQIQLFWMRKRELALRMINGAKRHQLFGMMIMEIAATIIISSALSIFLGILLRNSEFAIELQDRVCMELFGSIEIFTILVCGGLVAICGLIIYIVLIKICNSNNGLSASMRRSNSHVFRNIMLGIQTFICMVLLSLTAALSYSGMKSGLKYNTPSNAHAYDEAITIQNHHNQDLYNELAQLPNIKKIFKEYPLWYCDTYFGLDTSGRKDPYTRMLFLPDTVAVDFRTIDAEYQRNESVHNNCCILSREFHERCMREGVISDGNIVLKGRPQYYLEDGSVTGGESRTLKVSGTFKALAYEYSAPGIIVIGEPDDKYLPNENWIIIAQSGKMRQLMDDAKACVEKVEPELKDNIVFAFKENIDKQTTIRNSILTGLWLLGLTSLILCISGIYSTAALDTRARRKEMAIRKVNGAKARDIAMIFVKSYIWILIPAIILSGLITWSILEEENQSVGILFLGIGISVASIVAVIAYHIRNIMKVNPSDIIVKE